MQNFVPISTTLFSISRVVRTSVSLTFWSCVELSTALCFCARSLTMVFHFTIVSTRTLLESVRPWINRSPSSVTTLNQSKKLAAVFVLVRSVLVSVSVLAVVLLNVRQAVRESVTTQTNNRCINVRLLIIPLRLPRSTESQTSQLFALAELPLLELLTD